MADIFSSWRMNRLEIPNRIVRSATWEGMAQADGTPVFETINMTAELAEGGVGLVFAGYAFVRKDGRGLPGQTGVHIDAMIGPLTRITDAVHKVKGLVGLQITHAGGQTKPEWIGGNQPVGPSNYIDPRHGSQVRELSIPEIHDLIEAYAVAAARAKAAGFDVVQLQACHGYLVSEFASPFYNKRTDRFGGSLQNRARFGLMALEAMRDMVGPGYPLCIKLNCTDGVEGGINFDEALQLAKMYEQASVDAIEVSGGIPSAGEKGSIRPVKSEKDEGYFLERAARIKEAVSCPVIAVGGFRSKSKVVQALDMVDAVAMSRPLVREPGLINKWHQGSSQKAECISCGLCLQESLAGELCCTVVRKKAEKLTESS
jgi:2,4-dienoyl-CoA reductase-like NADH-dependent reductase (Old Yellow Enzyme family)